MHEFEYNLKMLRTKLYTLIPTWIFTPPPISACYISIPTTYSFVYLPLIALTPLIRNTQSVVVQICHMRIYIPWRVWWLSSTWEDQTSNGEPADWILSKRKTSLPMVVCPLPTKVGVSVGVGVSDPLCSDLVQYNI